MKYEKVNRPWGWYRILEKKEKLWIKIIFVKKGERLSLQSHENRSEIWAVLKGKIDTVVGNKNQTFGIGGIIKIGRQEKHRLAGLKNSYILEIAFGRPRERDIIRYEDDYGRA
jgi:mannose-6-phosphate isomerase-like protein (cupin superfamily)